MTISLLRDPTRYIFFTGKGGVGKTSLACATAVALADRGKRVLLVSTDPASNLGQVFECEIAASVTPIAGVSGLRAVNIEPDAAAAAYRERIMAPLRRTTKRTALPQVEEQLSGACTTEIATFDEFTRFLTDASLADAFDHIIFDTAPTGHTLRLLQLPAAWSTFIAENPDGASCLGPLSGLNAARAQYEAALACLNDAAATTVVLVSRADDASLKEAARTSAELSALGVTGQRLLINGVARATDRTDPLAVALERRGTSALETMPTALRTLPREVMALRPENIVGLASLRALIANRPHISPNTAAPVADEPLPPSLVTLVDAMAQQTHGLVMVMGKGGVGKTSVAAAIAVELASRRFSVHLSTTDPAAHVADTLGGDVPGLTVSRIDPAVEVERYIARALATKGKDLDEEHRRLLVEDLRSPCTEEVAVFHAFSRIVSDARKEFVVLDTAPTGHTLLLLDAAGSYHREVLRTSAIPARRITTPLMRLSDPAYTKVLIVTLAETTPVLEAEELQRDLRRAGIEPFAWVINQSLAAASPSDPLLCARADAELPLIRRVQHELARRAAIIPMFPDSPVGATALRAIVAGASIADAGVQP